MNNDDIEKLTDITFKLANNEPLSECELEFMNKNKDEIIEIFKLWETLFGG